ncbi:DNA alkylation repair protein [Paenibacillus sp. N3/727]|uniref:DNA alkylation repair protein n=1 Tax=Paenibacillus sp. N3/727 TaxID=2925845 RepID=UPI001F537700|nr:DNA alkylation repair protein [Paenibacillus sp. N3/727]UNK16263.1 DNA alkylation repair protein [Paenibacillus sp. N3/727]
MGLIVIEKMNSISDTILQRKGARKVNEIPPEVVSLLQKGALESVNLTEWLAVDHLELLRNILPEIGLEQESEPMLTALYAQNEKRIMKIIPAVANEWLVLLERQQPAEQTRIFSLLINHRSDSVRCWAAYIVGLNEKLNLQQKFSGIRPFAADSHFGVREISWMAVRELIINNLEQSLNILTNWVTDLDPNIRRFAIESTRPQGVWAKHIPVLKENPTLALPLLEIVKSDPSRYVQDSVGNWLNDASKSNPDWVIKLCKDWSEASIIKETKRIVSRAQRSLSKDGLV